MVSEIPILTCALRAIPKSLIKELENLKSVDKCIPYGRGGARGVMVIVVGNGHTATRVQILDETDCISLSTNTLGKGMNPIILPPAMGKY